MAAPISDWQSWGAELVRRVDDLTRRVTVLESTAKLDELVRLVTIIGNKVDKQLVTPDDLSALDKIVKNLNLLDPVK